MRRKFLDAALCQRKPAYARLLSQYSRTLAQRNTLLKDISYHSELLETLEIWDEKLSGLGAAITIERKRYLERLSEAAGEIYDGISQGRERFAVRYDSGLLRDGGEEAGYRERLFSLLQNGRKEDLNAGFTTKGPHRDDLLVTVQEKSAREYGSQGQQRSCVLALKLAEAALLAEALGEKPVILLDDVMSELDAARRRALVAFISGDIQTFITTTNLAYFDDDLLGGARIVELEKPRKTGEMPDEDRMFHVKHSPIDAQPARGEAEERDGQPSDPAEQPSARIEGDS